MDSPKSFHHLSRTPPPRSTLLLHLSALNARLDSTLRKGEIAFGIYDEDRPSVPAMVGAGAGALGGMAAGAMLPRIARSQVNIDQAGRNAQAQRIRTARTQDRVARANGLSNERIPGAGLKTTGKLGMGGKIRNANFRLNKRMAGGGGRGIAAGVLGIGGALAGYGIGKLMDQ